MTDLLVSGLGLQHSEFLQVAGCGLSDPDPLARDFAMHVVSSFASSHPDAVWSHLCGAVSRVGRESRQFLGVTVLEELLQHHFVQIFPALQREVVAGKRGLLDALASAWFDENRGPNYRLAQEYLASEGHGRGRRRRFAA
jgi:hypothetical protein